MSADDQNTNQNSGIFPRRTLIIIFVGILSIIFSITGELIKAGGGVSLGQLTDLVLRAVAYLALDGFDPFDISGPEVGGAATWFIRFGRVFAVIFVIIAAGMLLDAAFHFVAGWRRGQIALRGGHDLIIGGGWYGKELIKNCNDNGKPTIVIDINPDEIVRSLCMSKGIPLLTGDPRDKSMLQRAGIQKAKRVFICAGSDELNIDITYFVARIRKENQNDFVIAVNLNSKSVQYMRYAIDQAIDVRVFNSVDSTVNTIFSGESYRIDRFEDESKPKDAHIVLIGDDVMAGGLLLQSLQTCIFEEEATVKVDVLRPDARNYAKKWVEEFPCFHQTKGDDSEKLECKPEDVWLQEKVLPVINFHKLPATKRGLVDWCDKFVGSNESVVTVVVAMRDASETINIVDAVAARLSFLVNSHRKNIEVWIYLNNPNCAYRESLKESLNARHALIKPKIFFDHLGNLSRDTATGQELDDIAKRVNGLYALDGSPVEISTTEIDDIWKKCSDMDKASSRRSATHVFIKKRIRGRIRLQEETLQERKEIEDQKLKEIEHRRWCADHLLKGFTPLVRSKSYQNLDNSDMELIEGWFSRGKKNCFKEQSLHVDLIPFEDLPKLLGKQRGEAGQKKDSKLVEHLYWLETGKSHST